MSRLAPWLAGLAILALACVGTADLISADLSAPGDALITRDPASGLEWLDLSHTTGFSYEQIAGGAGGFTSLGFRHATLDEVEGILLRSGFTLDGLAEPYVVGAQFISMLGCTYDCISSTGFSVAFADKSPPSSLIKVQIAISLSPGPPAAAFVTYRDVPAFATADPAKGHYLVRAVPEPGIVILFLPLVLLIAQRRARHAEAGKGAV